MNKVELTATDIEDMYNEEAWGGFGYLGERRSNQADQLGNMIMGDTLLLNYANKNDWDVVDLFNFCNSRDGRHYGDLIFGGFTPREVADQAPRFFTDFEKWNTKGALA